MVDQSGPSQDDANDDPMQSAVTTVIEKLSGNEDPEAVRAALTDELAAAGIPEQPKKWIEDTASEIAAGRSVYVHGLASAEPRDGDVPSET